MESPARHPVPASIEGQESPLFNFLNALSPIKPVKSLHTSHSFVELSFPPPPPVFVTPRIHAKSSLQGSKHNRIHSHLESDQGTAQIGSNTKDCSLLVQEEERSMQGQDQSSHLLCVQPSTCVESQIAEYVKVESNTAGSSFVSLASKAEDGRLSPERVIISRSSQQCMSLGTDLTIVSTDGLCNGLGVIKNREQRATLASNLDDSQCNQLQESLTAVKSSSLRTPSNEEALEPCQDAANVSLVQSEIAHRPSSLNENSGVWQDGALSSLSGMSIQHTTSSVLSVKTQTSTQEEAQHRQSDRFLATTFQVGDDTSVNGPRHPESETTTKVNFHTQRGFRRRCLDFRISDEPTLFKTNSWSMSHIAASCSSGSDVHIAALRERISATPDAAKTSDSMNSSLCYDLRESGCAPPSLDLQPAAACPTSVNSSFSPNMPCRIGLHLNSLTGSIPPFQSLIGEIGDVRYLASMKLVGAGVVATPPSMMESAYQPVGVPSSSSSAVFGKSLKSGTSFEEFGNSLQQGTNVEGPLVMSLIEELEMDLCKGHGVNAFESTACVGLSATRNIQRSECMPYGGVHEKVRQLDQEMLSLPAVPVPCRMETDGGQDGSSLSGKKARKRVSTADNYETGCKRCNCKKSKCLKLYCECFAAGLFCVDPCSCQDCHNKLGFEETVLETRQQIESRNPLAFAPRVVQPLAQSPISGERSSDFTPSARHKKGCSCKKSKCLKKYCECYQAGVGCSDVCRCEDCQNLYGRKEGDAGFDGKDVQAEFNERVVTEEKMDTSEPYSNFNHVSEYEHDDLTPITPSFQSAGQIGSVTMRRVTKRRCLVHEELQSSDSHFPTGRCLPASPVPISHEVAKSGQASPQWDGFATLCTLTPLPQAPQRKTAVSASFSFGTGSSPSIDVSQSIDASCSRSDSVDNMKVAQCSSPVLYEQCVGSCDSAGYALSLMGFQGNPKIPITVNGPLHGIGPDTPCEDLSFRNTKTAGAPEDDAFPEILKETQPACASLPSLKSNSPKQKRVSPPHFVGLRITSQQSPALRNGRKFRLQSVSPT